MLETIDVTIDDTAETIFIVIDVRDDRDDRC